MTITIAQLPQSTRRVLVGRVVAALQADATLQALAVPVVHNPRNPQALAVGPLVLVIKDMPDKLEAFENGKPRRDLSFVLAAIARPSSSTGAQDADDHADRLHHHAASVIRAAQASYSTPAGPGQVRLKALVTEVQTVFEVQGLSVDGALVASTWSIRYQ